MYRARTCTVIVLLILATIPLHTVAATDGTNDNAAASEAYERAVLQAQGQVMAPDGGDTLVLEDFARAELQAQGQVMVPNLAIASVGPDNYERATLAAEGQVFVQISAQAALSGQ